MKIGFLITARLKSTRLPMKLMLELNNKPVIWQMIDRLKQSIILDRIIICTSTNQQDNPLIEVAKKRNIDHFQGDEEDVILRLYEAAREFKLDYALNVTADNPLVSLEYIEKIPKKFTETNADLITCYKLPIGFYLWGLKIEAMKHVCEIKKSSETEVWGTYFEDSGFFNVIDMDVPSEYIRPDYRLTLDYPEDYELLKRIFKHFGENTHKISMSNIIKYLDDNPEIAEINKHCGNLYKKRWEDQNKLASWEN